MSTLSPTSKRLFPRWTNDLFDSGTFFNPRLPDFDRDFNSWDLHSNIPTVNVVENTKDYRLEMAVPGKDKKDFKIKVENHELTISSEKKDEVKEKKENYMRREFSYSSFSRTFRLPDNCIAEKIEAKYENGILILTLPKKEATVSNSSKEIKVS